MPSIPSGQQRVGPSPLPGIRQNPNLPIEAFGGGRALAPLAAAGQVIDGAVQIAQKMAEDDDKLELSQAKRALDRFQIKTRNQAQSRKGANAKNLFSDVDTGYEKFTNDYEKGLKSNRVKQMFREMADSRRHEELGWAAGYQHKEHEREKGLEYDAAVESSKKRAAALANDPDVEIERRAIYGEVADRATDQGWGPDYTKMEMATHESELHKRVIGKILADGDPIRARDYIGKYGKFIEPTTAATLDQHIQREALEGESRRLADEATSLVGKASSDESAPGPYLVEPTREEAMAKIDKMKFADAVYGEKVKKRAETLVRQEFTLREQIRTEKRKSALDAAYQSVEKNASVEEVKADPDIWLNVLTPSDRTGLENRANRLAKGSDIKTDWQKFAEFKGLTQDELLGMGIGELTDRYGEHLGRKEFEKAKLHWASARKPEEFKSAMSDNQIVLKGMAEGNVGGVRIGDTMADINKSNKKSKAYSDFLERVESAKAAFHAKEKKNPNDDQLQKIIDKLALEKVTIDNPWYIGDAEVLITELTDEQIATKEFLISEEDKDLLNRFEAVSGKKASQEQINRAYLALRQQKDQKEIEAIFGD